MSYLQQLLDQQGPLEPHEKADLKQWLETLEADCKMFGETPEDALRIAFIRRRILSSYAGLERQEKP